MGSMTLNIMDDLPRGPNNVPQVQVVTFSQDIFNLLVSSVAKEVIKQLEAKASQMAKQEAPKDEKTLKKVK